MIPFQHISISCLFLASAFCIADPVPVVVGGRAFPCHFEDGALSVETKTAIAADLAAIWGNWPDSTVELGEENGFVGKLLNPAAWQSPYLSGKDVPDWLCREGTNLMLHVSAAVSAEYADAITQAAAHADEFAALRLFVESLSPAALSNATPAALSALLYRSTPVTAENRGQIVSELVKTRFAVPSLLGVGFAPRALGTVPAGTLVAGIPRRSANATPPFYAVWPAAWLEDRWQLLPLY